MGFVEDFVDLAFELVMHNRNLVYPHPTLTYGPNGYEFNGLKFGNNEQAAKQARSAYWNDSGIHAEDFPQEPLTLDYDLKPAE